MLCLTFDKTKARAIRMNYPVAILLVLLWLFTSQAEAASFSGKLVKVLDGDTVEVLHDGKAERIRLAQIDAPEKNQPFGQAAKRYVLERAVQKVVIVDVETIDRYGRTVGEIFFPDGSNLNKQIVGAGYAWEYKRYSKDKEYGLLESQARASSLGLWQGPGPIPPWEWRRGKRTSIQSVLTAEGFICGSKTYCKQMTSCAEARFYLNECGLTRLDGNGDGVPCESVCR
jgi:endonuclease YncB( thermonuclease family)